MQNIAPSHPPYLYRNANGEVIAYPYTGEKFVEYDFHAYGSEDQNAEKAYWQYCHETYTVPAIRAARQRQALEDGAAVYAKGLLALARRAKEAEELARANRPGPHEQSCDCFNCYW